MAGPRDDNELRQTGKFRCVLPFMQPRQLVATDDPEELAPGQALPEISQGLDRVAEPALAQFVIGNLELRLRIDGEPQHRQPVTRRRHPVVRLAGNVRRRHEDDPVQPMPLPGGACRAQVSGVHGIEASA